MKNFSLHLRHFLLECMLFFFFFEHKLFTISTCFHVFHYFLFLFLSKLRHIWCLFNLFFFVMFRLWRLFWNSSSIAKSTSWCLLISIKSLLLSSFKSPTSLGSFFFRLSIPIPGITNWSGVGSSWLIWYQFWFIDINYLDIIVIFVRWEFVFWFCIIF